MYKVLFICRHNSTRSQIAEAYLKEMGGEHFLVESAGFDPGPINPDVIRVLQEEGIDISHKTSQKVFDLFKQGKIFDFVITVCEQEEGQCPVFPGVTHRLHLPFPDPAQVTGDEEERLAAIRSIRDQIKANISEFACWVPSGEKRSLSELWEQRSSA